MKENTYDVPAYKFFIVKINDGKKEHSPDEYTHILYNNPNRIIRIPFEDVDGLTIQEVKDLLHRSDIVLLSCISYEGEPGILQHSVLNIFYVDFKDDNLKEDDTIDKVFERLMEKNYMQVDDTAKRVMQCYFERYQDKSYEKTKQRIMSLVMQNKKR